MRAAARLEARRTFLVELGRALGGAMVFSMPMFMTMEMWDLGATMDRTRLALMLCLLVPLLVGLSHYVGLEDTFDWHEDLVDAFIAIAVAFTSSVLILLLLAALGPGMGADEIAGKIAVQMVPAGMGAMLARSQFGERDSDEAEERRGGSYWAQVFFMAVGALFLSFSIAPTEEVRLIAAMMGPWHLLSTVLVSVVTMHAFVYAVSFRGQEQLHPEGASFLSVFVRYTLVGYMVALGVSLYVLWTFGQLDGMSVQAVLASTLVLGFPSATGAAAARLIL